MNCRREALRRLGAKYRWCIGCREHVLGELKRSADWRTNPITAKMLCGPCDVEQRRINEAHIKRTVHDELAIERDTRRAQMEPSSDDYRAACAAMHDDVTDMLGPDWDV